MVKAARVDVHNSVSGGVARHGRLCGKVAVPGGRSRVARGATAATNNERDRTQMDEAGERQMQMSHKYFTWQEHVYVQCGRQAHLGTACLLPSSILNVCVLSSASVALGRQSVEDVAKRAVCGKTVHRRRNVTRNMPCARVAARPIYRARPPPNRRFSRAL